MTTTTPAPRPRRNTPARPDARRGAGPAKKRRRIRWGRIPGRLILAVCFAIGALALGAAVIPFTTTAADGTELRCGPAVFEALMPPDPEFDDVPENAGCAEPAKTRLLIGGGALAGAVLVAAITERQTRRGSHRRDTRWLASSSARSSRRRRDRRAAATKGSTRAVGSARTTAEAVDRAASDDRSLPPSSR